MLAPAAVQNGGEAAAGCSARFTGKSPTLTCLPAGRSDHWLGSSTDPSSWSPGRVESGLAATPLAAAAQMTTKTSWERRPGIIAGGYDAPRRIQARRRPKISCA
jgi:hypothetical protein